MCSEPISSRRKTEDGSVLEFMVLNGAHVTLKFAPDSERDRSADTMESVRESLFRVFSENDKLAIPPADCNNEHAVL